MRRRILLADDSVTIQKVIELTFLDEDYDVKAVSNGDEAIAVLPQVNPDFVIADVHMPGANGYEVCRRSKELLPEVPVLLLVGTFEPFDEAQSRSVGADSFLKKPFDSQELLQRVEELLAARSGLAPPAAAAALSPPPPAPPITDWGSFQVEPAPVPPTAEPFPAPVPFHQEDQPFPPFGESSFEEPSFVLDEEPAGGDLRVDESGLLPAGEPLFELDGTADLRLGSDIPSFEAPPFDPAPALDTSAFDTPSFDPPSFEPSSFEPPSFETPSFETPSFEPPSFEPPSPAAETRRIDTVAFQDYGFDATPEERLGVPQEAVPLVESRAEVEARIEAPPPPSIQASHEPESAAPAAPAGGLAVGSVVPAGSPAGNGGALSDADVDRIARRVVELIADRAVRDVAWEVIP